MKNSEANQNDDSKKILCPKAGTATSSPKKSAKAIK